MFLLNGSNERISFIIEYISAYEAKIKLANSNHLFDEAQLFELFAQEICKIWYGQEFTNLNSIKMNYPCVDLLSADGRIYVQVSTQKDIREKIKDTLNKLNESNDPIIGKIDNPVFFVLSNESENKVKDLVNAAQIGRFPFIVDKNFISTHKVVERARKDVEFQIALYELLKRDVEGLSSLSEKLLNVFDQSRNIGLSNIISRINDEYEIDRSAFINSVKSELCQFNLVCGEAGSGKSVICKKLIENERNLLFVRTDKLLRCNSIDDLWGISVSNAFRYLKSQRSTVYVDALEYISNAGESTKELLQSLLYEISKHPNITFIASCRSCDVGAFIRIIARYNIKQFVVAPVSSEELKELSRKYRIIKEMAASEKYEELLHSPFYINEIVSRKIDLSVASDVNAFRDYIWEKSICLTEKAAEMNIPTDSVVKTVEHIVIERSRRFSPGVSEYELDSKILALLRSNNVIVDKDHLIRLKYDIYEDICFEKIFDREFDLCRGIFQSFFDSIMTIGDGIYRRYHIWISNKLLEKKNRNKFLNSLIFEKEISLEWHQDTIVGVLKSPFCKSFFDEYGAELINHGLVQEFLNLTNCFCYEMRDIIFNETRSLCSLQLAACGYGRIALIQLIYNNELYKNGPLDKDSIIKLCRDYARFSNGNNLTDEYVCIIVCGYLDELLSNIQIRKEQEGIDKVQQLLCIIYLLPNKASEWIHLFWEKLKKDYLSEDYHSVRIAKDILSWTLDHVNAKLIDIFYNELFRLAETIWMAESAIDAKQHEMYGYGYNNDHLWGINGAANDYHSSHRGVYNDTFIRLIFAVKFKPAFEWTLSLINKMVSEYARQSPENVTEVVLFDAENNSEKMLLGSQEMWFAGREDHMLPTIIGDLIYWLKTTIFQSLDACIENKPLFLRLTLFIKAQVFKLSNNLIPFTIIEEIGFKYYKLVPGYTSFLASNYALLSWDIQWCVHNMTSPAKTILMNQMLMSFGLPDLPDRYPKDNLEFSNIQDYMARSQLFFDDAIKSLCEKTIDYLYDHIDKKDSHVLLQAQKMDMRNADFKIDENIIAVSAALSEGPQKIVDEHRLSNQPVDDMAMKLKNIVETNDENNLDTVLDCIKSIKSIMCTEQKTFEFERYYITLMCLALTKPAITMIQRSELIDDWIKRLQGFINKTGAYIADFKLSYVLFSQIRSDISDEVRRKLKFLMLSCFLIGPEDGRLTQLRDILTKYLLTDGCASHYLFNSIIKIAEDEWNHTEYNLKTLKKNKRKHYSIPGGYGIPSHDDIIRAIGAKQYVSKRDLIIKNYLYEEQSIDLSKVDVGRLDPGYLFIAMSVGIRLSDADFYSFAKRVMPIFTLSMNARKSHSSSEYFYQRHAMKKMLERELTDEHSNYKDAVDLLFDNIDYDVFEHEAIDMYVSIFGYVDSLYFDAYNNEDRRKACRNCILYAESKINRIDNQYIKTGLEKILILYSDYYGDWSRCETHYSYHDKIFLCQMWEKYYRNHETEVLKVIYRMKIDELLPNILPVVSKLVDNLFQKDTIYDEEDIIILRTIVLKSLVSFSNDIKADMNFHKSYEKILNAMIGQNDENAAVILDEYKKH